MNIVAIGVYLKFAGSATDPLTNWFGHSICSLDCVYKRIKRIKSSMTKNFWSVQSRVLKEY